MATNLDRLEEERFLLEEERFLLTVTEFPDRDVLSWGSPDWFGLRLERHNTEEAAFHSFIETHRVDPWYSLRGAADSERTQFLQLSGLRFRRDVWNWIPDTTMSQAEATKIVEVFRQSHQRGGHVWARLDLGNLQNNNEHLLCVLSEAKSIGLFTTLRLDYDSDRDSVEPDSMIIRECLLMNPSLKSLHVAMDTLQTFQILRDCLRMIPNGAANANFTRLIDLNICCPGDYSSRLALLSEGLRGNNSLKSFRMMSPFYFEYIRSDQGITELVNALPTTLEELVIGDFVVTAPVQGAIIQRLVQPDCQLRELCLGNPEIGLCKFCESLDFASFADALKQNKSLRSLEFCKYYTCSVDHILLLLNALSEGSQLKTLRTPAALIRDLKWGPSSISPSSRLENLLMPRYFRPGEDHIIQRDQQSFVELLKAIPSLGDLGLLTEVWPNSPECTLESVALLDFNRITRGRLLKAIPLCLWGKLLDKFEKYMLQRWRRDTEEYKLRYDRCKASLIFCLLRSLDEARLRPLFWPNLGS